MSRPVSSSERLITLDIIRGIAILAVVFVNVVALTGPQWGMFDALANGPASTLDLAVFYGVRVVISGKFISIFALLFGMGLALQTEHIERSGPSAPIYRRRQGLLLLMGALHGVFLWWGDILFIYGVVGALVFLVRHSPAKALRRFGAAMIGIGMVMQASSFLALPLIPAQLEQANGLLSEVDGPGLTDSLTLEGVFAMLGQIEIQAFGGGPWWHALLLRLGFFLGNAVGGLLTFGVWVGGLMLLGVSLIREDFLQDRARQEWWIRWGIGVGLSIELFSNGVVAIGGFPIVGPIGAAMEALGALAKPVLALGWFSLLVVLCERLPSLKLFAPAGRMALSNYIGQSLVLNILFTHWGFGWFGTMGRFETFMVCVLLVTMQVLVSRAWLRHFQRGPLEAIWRRLTYGRP